MNILMGLPDEHLSSMINMPQQNLIQIAIMEKKTSFPSGEIASKTERGRGGIARETKYSRRISFALIIKLIDLAIWLVVRYYRDYK
ncbi:hypothetical protein NC652_018705 [Populus alba x Populus x berolinensis]|nr:hypothetical protein NC652_018705 [Populus alba x Populus x berolinensis]